MNAVPGRLPRERGHSDAVNPLVVPARRGRAAVRLRSGLPVRSGPRLVPRNPVRWSSGASSRKRRDVPCPAEVRRPRRYRPFRPSVMARRNTGGPPRRNPRMTVFAPGDLGRRQHRRRRGPGGLRFPSHERDFPSTDSHPVARDPVRPTTNLRNLREGVDPERTGWPSPPQVGIADEQGRPPRRSPVRVDSRSCFPAAVPQTTRLELGSVQIKSGKPFPAFPKGFPWAGCFFNPRDPGVSAGDAHPFVFRPEKEPVSQNGYLPGVPYGRCSTFEICGAFPENSSTRSRESPACRCAPPVLISGLRPDPGNGVGPYLSIQAGFPHRGVRRQSGRVFPRFSRPE